jgi:hypothetical protein
MKCVPELYKQLTHLSNTIGQCRYIPYSDKPDIIQNTLEKIVIKYNDGILKDDFEEIKGYTFMILRNCCNAYFNRNLVSYTDEQKEIEEEFINKVEEKDYKDYLHNQINTFMLDKRYSDIDREVCQLMLNNVEDKEIRKITGIQGNDLRAIKQAFKQKLKNDLKRPVRYLIKNRNRPDFKYICYTRKEVIDYFHSLNCYEKNYILTIIQSQKSTRSGYYIETINKKVCNRKKKTN